MKYKLKKFRVMENKKSWWTEKGLPGKADCKIISINLFYNGRENIPSAIKGVVENQANGIKNKSLNQQDIEDIRISATLKAIYPVISGNLGLRIGDILKLRLSDIIHDGDRYHLDIIEEKSGKKREFTVPLEIYAYIQNYALESNIRTTAKLFEISERAVNKHLQKVCKYLNLEGIGSHSFRKFFATTIYNNNRHNINLVRVLLQHSSIATTQRYIGLQSEKIEEALQNHIHLI